MNVLLSLLLCFLVCSCTLFENNNDVSETKSVLQYIKQSKASYTQAWDLNDLNNALSTCSRLIKVLDSLQVDVEYTVYADYYALYAEQAHVSFEQKEAFYQEEFRRHSQDENWIAVFYESMVYYYMLESKLELASLNYDLASNQLEKKAQWSRLHILNVSYSQQLYSIFGDVRQAQKYLDKGVEYQSRIDQLAIQPDVYSFKAALEFEQGLVEASISTSFDYIEMLSKKGGTEDQFSVAYSNIGSGYLKIKDYFNALKYYQKALNVLNPLGNKANYEIIIALINLAVVHGEMRSIDKEKNHLHQALDLIETIDLEIPFALDDYYGILSKLSYTYVKTNQIDSAYLYIRTIEEENRFKRNSHKAELAQLKAAYFHALDQSKDELEALNTALDFTHELYQQIPYHKQWSKVYRLFSDYYSRKNNLDKAIAYTDTTIQKSLSPSVNTKNNLSLLQNISNYDLFLLFHQKAQLLEKRSRQGDIHKAFECALKSIQLFEQTLRKINHLTSKKKLLQEHGTTLFETPIRLAIKLAIAEPHKKFFYHSMALKVAEQSKGILSEAKISISLAAKKGHVPPDLLREEAAISRSLSIDRKLQKDAIERNDVRTMAVLDSIIFESSLIFESLKNKLEQQYPAYYRLKYRPFSVSIKQIQTNLVDSTCMIMYFEGAEQLYAFWIDHQNLDLVVRDKPNDYPEKIDQFTKCFSNYTSLQMADSTIGFFRDQATYFFDLWLDHQKIKKYAGLNIIADGKMAYVPFEILIDPNNIEDTASSPIKYASLPYLLHDLSVYYNYSAAQWLYQIHVNTQVDNFDMLGVAATYDVRDVRQLRSNREAKLRKELVNLPGAIQEIKMLKSTMKGHFLIGRAATEKNVKRYADNYGLLHFATHGIINKENPSYSSLALYENLSKNEDNFLYAYELENMGIKTKLVVLSACESGAVKYQKGAAVMSLGHAFIMAGAPAVVSTLWPLNDYSSHLIMRFFYQNIVAGLPKDLSLRKAKLTYLNAVSTNQQHPFFWACFVQSGDNTALELIDQSTNSGSNASLIMALLVGLFMIVAWFVSKKWRSSKGISKL